MNNAFALRRIKEIMWAFAIAGLVAGVGRFAVGLGAATNMMDSLPWGLWKIFNMVGGAALATSGFVVACIIYIFKMERFKPVARLSVLIGFLGYGSSLVALVFDIGLPHRGWHPLVMWNPHSFLFEVFWCVSCYWGVTALELVPIVSERFPFPKFTHFMHEVMLPFVVLGITLSTMHHSSLGSLFLASPTRLHPLWHTMWIPPEFFVSAMGAGLSVIVLLALIISWLYGKERNMAVLTKLAKGSAVILAVYFVMKVADLTINGKWSYVFGADVTWESYVFWGEMLLQVIIPVAIIAIPKLRNRISLLFAATFSAFLGLVLHRLNTGITGYYGSSEQVYFPNLSEFILSFGVLSAAGLVFFFLIERFYIFDAPEGHGQESRIKFWTRKEAADIITSPDAMKVSFLSVVVIPLAIIGLGKEATGPFTPMPQPVSAPLALDEPRTEFRIDGNRNGDYVIFPHKKHVDEQGGEEESCIKCHHLSWPNDHNSSCRMCHRDMEVPSDLFDREAHLGREEWEEGKPCIECHRENMPGIERHDLKGFNHEAFGYKQAMHGLCITCHRLNEEDPADPKGLGNCQRCHPLVREEEEPIPGSVPKEETE